MIEQALQVLTLHIIWKGKGLTADVDPSPEETRLRETLKDQRQSLLEKLIEYAVGTQSNTVEGVKRAVCISGAILGSVISQYIPSGIQKSPRPPCSILIWPDGFHRWFPPPDRLSVPYAQ